MKEWLRLACKSFINDCSIGLFLIAIGFVGGLCYNILWNLFVKHLSRF